MDRDTRDTRPEKGLEETPAGTAGGAGEDLRAQAVARLRSKREFGVHLMVYLAVNGCLVLVWAMTGMPFFWPIFPLVFWGIGLVAHAWDVFGAQGFSEKRIQREIDRMKD